MNPELSRLGEMISNHCHGSIQGLKVKDNAKNITPLVGIANTGGCECNQDGIAFHFAVPVNWGDNSAGRRDYFPVEHKMVSFLLVHTHLEYCAGI